MLSRVILVEYVKYGDMLGISGQYRTPEGSRHLKTRLMSGTCIIPRGTFTVSVAGARSALARPLPSLFKSGGLLYHSDPVATVPVLQGFFLFLVRFKGRHESEKINTTAKYRTSSKEDSMRAKK